jgi:molybdate transport system regulatory protein
MSYRRAWELVEALNSAYQQPVVTTAIGGRRGGGARVTPFGRRIAADFRAMEAKASRAIAADLRRFEARLRKRRTPR